MLILVDIIIMLPNGKSLAHALFMWLMKRGWKICEMTSEKFTISILCWLSEIDETRLRRDERRNLNDEDYDYVIVNNGKKAELFKEIERIYEEIKNK